MSVTNHTEFSSRNVNGYTHAAMAEFNTQKLVTAVNMVRPTDNAYRVIPIDSDRFNLVCKLYDKVEPGGYTHLVYAARPLVPGSVERLQSDYEWLDFVNGSKDAKEAAEELNESSSPVIKPVGIHNDNYVQLMIADLPGAQGLGAASFQTGLIDYGSGTPSYGLTMKTDWGNYSSGLSGVETSYAAIANRSVLDRQFGPQITNELQLARSVAIWKLWHITDGYVPINMTEAINSMLLVNKPYEITPEAVFTSLGGNGMLLMPQKDLAGYLTTVEEKPLVLIDSQGSIALPVERTTSVRPFTKDVVEAGYNSARKALLY